MGGCCCCCSSKGVELNSSPPYYHYPRVPEEHEPLSSHSATAGALSTGLLVDTNLDTSILDTYRSPPLPIPYDSNLRHSHTPPGSQENKDEAAVQATSTEPVAETNTGNTNNSAAKLLNKSGEELETNIELVSLKELDDELEKSGELKKSAKPIISGLEEDICPTCLEEYDADNPKIITKCEHHFHLSCIYEWLERSDTCPVCDQEMIFNA